MNDPIYVVGTFSRIERDFCAVGVNAL